MKSNLKWMVASKGRKFVLLHLNDERLEQYDELKRVPKWIIKKYVKQSTR